MIDSKQEKMTEALALCRRELAQVREQQEPLMEEVALLRVQAKVAQEVSSHLASALSSRLSTDYWEQHTPSAPIAFRKFIGSRWPWLKRRFGAGGGAGLNEELQQVRLLEASKLFDADWYLARYADVARAGIYPALHYLQSGAFEGRDPGPEFSTQAYFEEHPELKVEGGNPLVHLLQTQATVATNR